MNASMTYKKSARGTEAIATRDRALAPKLRSLLIMVDGKRTGAELSQLMPAGDFTAAFDQLLQMGFVEEAAPATAPARQQAQEPVAALGHVPLAEAQRFAVRRLTDLLGPTADDFCLKIEGTRNATEFMNVMHRVESMLSGVIGPREVEAFMQDIERHRPA